MKGRSYAGTVIAIAILLLTSVGRAHGQASASPPVNDEILQHMHELEQTVKELQIEVAALKSGEKSAPAAVPQNNLVSSAAATPTAAPPGPSLAGLLGPTSLSGFVDVYYGQNFNNPTSRSNAFRFFDGATNQFGLNMVELVLDKAPDANNSRTGYRVALGFGQAMNAVNGSDFGGLGFDQYLKEAYFSYLA